MGLIGAFKTGIKYAYKYKYDCALQFDGDGQHRPEHIKSMMEELKDNNIVSGSRFKTEKKPFSLRMWVID